MEDIAAHLGVSKGALYLYFKSKDDLIFESAKIMQVQLCGTAMTTFPNSDPLDIWIEFLDNFMPLTRRSMLSTSSSLPGRSATRR